MGNHRHSPPAGGVKLLSSAEFTDGYVPPDYLVDGILQRRYLYSLTAQTGDGKTAVALLLAHLVATGTPLGRHDCEAGRVLYLAGENPNDVRSRWLFMSEVMKFDRTTACVDFIDSASSLDDISQCVVRKRVKGCAYALVIVDTSAAFFRGDDENSNTQFGDHARALRRLTQLPGHPCVVACCHPTKKERGGNLQPRGGGAFIAEVDGNLTLSRAQPESVLTLNWSGKFRGPSFDPISLKLEQGTCPALKDSKGRRIPSVYAKCLEEIDAMRLHFREPSLETKLISAMDQNHAVSIRTLADIVQSNTAKVQRVLSNELRTKKLAMKGAKGGWILTKQGKAQATKLEAFQR